MIWIKKDKFKGQFDGLTFHTGDGKYDEFFLGDKKLQFIHEHWDAICRYVETNELPDEVAPPDSEAQPEAPPKSANNDDDDDLPF